MSCRLILAPLGALALLTTFASSSTQQSATPESANPINDQGASFDYRSYITAVDPPVPGLQLEVLEFADRLQLRNHTGQTVTIYGYSGEPYARVLANGTTEENLRSPAVYLNQNFYGQVTVPAQANPDARPRWSVIDRTGQFQWHDHRIHWMSPVRPAKVKNASKRTKIFDWEVPIAVGRRRGAVHGELFWVPDSSKAPLAAIIALIALVAAAIGFVLFMRARRARSHPHGPDSTRPNGPSACREAW